MEPLLIAFIVFIAVFIQTASGFGLGLVGMPLLATIISLEIARPLIVAVAMLSRIFMLLRYRSSLTLNTSIWHIMIAMIVGIGLGFALFRQFDGRTVQVILGVFVVVYAIYSLIAPKIPELTGKKWALGLGTLSGILSGAYNAGGPPLVIYANGRKWTPIEFKSNLQMLALINGITSLSFHIVEGNFTSTVINNWLYTIPAVILGSLLGFALDKYINPVIFRKVILIMLIGIGINLIV